MQLTHVQNLKGRLATSLYSCFENLYFSVVRNLGFTSSTKPLTSSAIGCRCSSVYSVALSISLFHTLTFLMALVARISDAAASSLELYLSSEASRSAIS